MTAYESIGGVICEKSNCIEFKQAKDEYLQIAGTNAKGVGPK
jgi:hypothetical protein